MASAEHEALRESVRQALSRTPTETLWTTLCDQIGVAALAIPEAYGGLGATLAETHVVLEELGRVLAGVPLLGSAVLAAHALLGSNEPAACGRLLPGIADGTTIAAVAWAGPEGRWDPSAPACAFADGRISGEAHYVVDGQQADALIVAARTADGVGLFEVEPNVTRRTTTPAMDATRKLTIVRFDDAPARPLTLAAEPVLATLRDIACVALSAEQVGTAQRCLDMTVEYSKTRVQFGRPIGGFQALKHRMADMHVLVETARSASYAAVHSAVHDPDRLPLLAAVAKTHCSEALSTVAGEMIQLHGGIAITWEHDAHRYFKRAHGSAQLFGQSHEHASRISLTY